MADDPEGADQFPAYHLQLPEASPNPLQYGRDARALWARSNPNVEQVLRFLIHDSEGATVNMNNIDEACRFVHVP